MKLRRLARDMGSEQGGCPAVYAAVDGQHFVVQGKVLDAHTTSQLQQVLPDETAGLIPVETVLRAVDKYRAEQGL